MNKRLKDKKILSGMIAGGGFLIILAGSALSQQTALGQSYQGVYVDGAFVGYVAENVDVKDVILQARRKLAEESENRLCMDYEWSVKTEKKPFQSNLLPSSSSSLRSESHCLLFPIKKDTGREDD